MPAPGGQRLCIHHAPIGPTRGAVLYVHPWAEEMNKARRMAALQSGVLANAGYAVLRLDLLGCGDSSGEFVDASWSGWVDDVLLGARWLQQRYAVPLHLWGLRAGALLATQAAAQLAQPCHFLFWQPALAGKQLLHQFLRLKAAANLQQGDAKATMAEAREALEAGQTVDVAGYTLGPTLAQGLESATLELPPQSAGVTWLEISTRELATLLPASAARVESWRAAGHRVHAEVVPGPAFWQTQEIEDAPQLLSATLAALQAHMETVAA